MGTLLAKGLTLPATGSAMPVVENLVSVSNHARLLSTSQPYHGPPCAAGRPFRAVMCAENLHVLTCVRKPLMSRHTNGNPVPSCTREDLMFRPASRKDLMFHPVPRKDLMFCPIPPKDLMFRHGQRKDLMFRPVPRKDPLFCPIPRKTSCSVLFLRRDLMYRRVLARKALMCCKLSNISFNFHPGSIF
jgi:hypothetical protein